MKKSIIYDHLLTAAKQEGTSISDILSFAASLGYVGADVHWKDADAIHETYKTLNAAGLSFSSVYRFWDFSLPVDQNDANAFFACLREHGCDHAMIIPRNEGGKSGKDAEFKSLCDRMNELCNIAKCHEITVTVEDFDTVGEIISNTETLKRIFTAVPKLCHTFDTGNYAYFYESPLAAFDLFKDKIVHVHLKDRALAPASIAQKVKPLCDGKTAYSCAVGKGFVGIESCIKLLHQNGYDGYLSVEHYGLDQMKEAIRESAAYIDRVLANIEK